MNGTLLGIWARPDDDAYLSAGLMADAVAAATASSSPPPSANTAAPTRICGHRGGRRCLPGARQEHRPDVRGRRVDAEPGRQAGRAMPAYR